MGKKKVELKLIQNPISRHATFYKRKGGLLKKAFELSVLCGAEVAVIILSETGKVHEFASHDDVPAILSKYRIHKERTRKSKSSLSSLQNTQFDQLQLKRLHEKIDLLEKKQKNMVGEDLESLTMKELHQLEKKLQKSMRRICNRKMKIFSENFKLLLEKLQLKRLQEKINILEKREKNMVGEDLESLTTKELQQLENKLQKSIGRICNTKVRCLEEENTELHTQLSTTGDYSISAPNLYIRASIPKTYLHLGLPYNTMSSGGCDGN